MSIYLCPQLAAHMINNNINNAVIIFSSLSNSCKRSIDTKHLHNIANEWMVKIKASKE